MHACTHAHLHVGTNHMHACTYTRILQNREFKFHTENHVYMHTYVVYVQAYMHVYMHTYVLCA